MIKFEVYAGSTMEDLGTPAQLVGKKGTLQFSNKNITSEKINDKGNRVAVVVIMKNAKGESVVVSCSQAVSASVRKALEGGMERKQALAIIAKLSILEGETGIPFISAPAGESTADIFTVEQLATEKVANYEALIAF